MYNILCNRSINTYIYMTRLKVFFKEIRLGIWDLENGYNIFNKK